MIILIIYCCITNQPKCNSLKPSFYYSSWFCVLIGVIWVVLVWRCHLGSQWVGGSLRLRYPRWLTHMAAIDAGRRLGLSWACWPQRLAWLHMLPGLFTGWQLGSERQSFRSEWSQREEANAACQTSVGLSLELAWSPFYHCLGLMQS